MWHMFLRICELAACDRFLYLNDVCEDTGETSLHLKCSLKGLCRDVSSWFQLWSVYATQIRQHSSESVGRCITAND